MIHKLLKVFFIMIIIFYVNSCDILRLSPFEVISWSPGEGYHSETEKIVVSLKFSHNPDKDSVERRFSLSGDGGRVKGTFKWEGNKLFFTPLAPLEKNTDYVIELSADIHDTDGLSMDAVFEGKFTTRAGTERPAVLSCYPSMYAYIDDYRTEIAILFSSPLPLNALYDNVSFSPSMTGSWRLEEDGKLAIFTPAELWIFNSRYEIKISSSLTNNNGMNSGYEFKSVFSTGIDREPPVLLDVKRITKNGETVPLVFEEAEESDRWEKDDKLFLIFSEPVDSLSVKNCLSAENAPSLIMETYPGYNTEFIFRFDTIPVYESRIVFKIKSGIKDVEGNESKEEYVCKVCADGEFSKPPSLVGIRFPMAPGSDTDREVKSYGIDSLFEMLPITDGAENYPSGERIDTWIEFYFSTASGASINIFSLMELFRIETSNNVLTFSPRQIKTENFSVVEPEEGWEEFQRIEITGTLINSTDYGVINFLIASGLKDTLGNRNEKMFRISVLK